MAGTLFTDVRILDCTGAEPYFGEALVQATRIAAVVREPQQLPREDVDVIDGRGATLMPGLIESHAHLSIDDAADLVQIGMDSSGGDDAHRRAQRAAVSRLRHHQLHQCRVGETPDGCRHSQCDQQGRDSRSTVACGESMADSHRRSGRHARAEYAPHVVDGDHA